MTKVVHDEDSIFSNSNFDFSDQLYDGNWLGSKLVHLDICQGQHKHICLIWQPIAMLTCFSWQVSRWR